MQWTRILARTIDYCVFYTLIFAFGFGNLLNIILLFLLPLLFFPLEGVCYYYFKTTPAKWIFGIHLSKKLSLLSSLKLAFKKSLLVLPLLYAPLNIFFIVFYLKESEEHKYKRWNQFEGAKIIFKKRKKLLKNAILVVLSVLFIVAYTPASFKNDFISISKSDMALDNWVEVKDSHLNFSVYFPEEPKVVEKQIHVEEQNTNLDVKEYTHDAKVSYSLVSSKIPSSWTLLGSNYLFKALSKPIEEHQGKIISKNFAAHGKHPAMKYLIKNTSGGQTKGALILVKTTIYKLEVTAKKDLSATELDIANDFIDSFDVN